MDYGSFDGKPKYPVRSINVISNWHWTRWQERDLPDFNYLSLTQSILKWLSINQSMFSSLLENNNKICFHGQLSIEFLKLGKG